MPPNELVNLHYVTLSLPRADQQFSFAAFTSLVQELTEFWISLLFSSPFAEQHIAVIRESYLPVTSGS